MNETDAVSCLLCLQADEYGSMIKVCVPPGRIPPSPERVICRRCAEAIAYAALEQDGEEIVQPGNNQTVGNVTGSGARDAANPDRDDWSSDLSERAIESLVEGDRSEPEDATRSSRGTEAGRVASGKTDD